MSNWTTYKLGELIEVQNGYAFKSEDFSKSGIPVIKIKNIVSPRISFNDVEYFEGEINERLKTFLINKDDILISMTGSHLNQIASAVGKVGRYQFDFPALLNQRVGKLYSKDGSVLDNDFLYYFISKLETQIELVTSAGGGGNQANISPSQIKSLEIIIPSIGKQKSIASILSSLSEKVELNLQLNQTLEEMAHAIFKEWFINFNFPGFDGDLVDGLPNGWKKGTVSDISVVNKNTLSVKDDLKVIDYIEISEVSRGVINNITTYNRGTEPSRAKRKLNHGDTVMSTVRPDRGSYFLAINPHENLIASTGFAVFSATIVPFSFLYCFLTDADQIEFYGKMADGAAYPAINPSVIMNMELNIPSIEILESFHSIAEKLYLKINENLLENKTLVQLRDNLLPQLMTGKIEVKA